MTHIIEIPAIRTADGPSITIQTAAAAGSQLAVVTVFDRAGARCDRWFGHEADALAYAIELAAARDLLLFDLRDGVAE